MHSNFLSTNLVEPKSYAYLEVILNNQYAKSQVQLYM